jgi:hypothetical protein
MRRSHAWLSGSLAQTLRRSGQQRYRLSLIAPPMVAAGLVILAALILVFVAVPETGGYPPLPEGNTLDFGLAATNPTDLRSSWTLVGWTADSSRVLLVCNLGTIFVGETNAVILDVRAPTATSLNLFSFNDAMPPREVRREQQAERARTLQRLQGWMKSNSPLQQSVCGLQGPGGRSIKMPRVSHGVAEADPPENVPIEIRGPGRRLDRAMLTIPQSDYPQPEDHLLLLPCWSPDGANVIFVARPTETTVLAVLQLGCDLPAIQVAGALALELSIAGGGTRPAHGALRGPSATSPRHRSRTKAGSGAASGSGLSAGAPPADAQEPGGRRGHGRSGRYLRGEEGDGAERVAEAGAELETPAARVVREVPEDVAQRVGDLAAGPQHVRVKALGEDSAAPAHHAVERPRHANRERLHPAGKRLAVLRLHDEVHVIPLHRKMDHPEAEAVAACLERALEGEQGAAAAQVPAASSDAQRGVDGVVPRELGPAQVRGTCVALWLAPCARPEAAPRRGEAESSLDGKPGLGGLGRGLHVYDFSGEMWTTQDRNSAWSPQHARTTRLRLYPARWSGS